MYNLQLAIEQQTLFAPFLFLLFAIVLGCVPNHKNVVKHTMMHRTLLNWTKLKWSEVSANGDRGKMTSGPGKWKVAVRVCRFSVRCIKSKQNWFENCTRQGTHTVPTLLGSKRDCTRRKVLSKLQKTIHIHCDWAINAFECNLLKKYLIAKFASPSLKLIL